MSTSYLGHPLVLSVEGRPAKVHVGGSGDALLLVHGGWGSAMTHWSRVWAVLAERFRVIAPELPGLGDLDHPGLHSVTAYAAWLASLLDALNVQAAWCVGNSFGASVVSRFAADFPQRTQGLVLVDGFPMPPTPPWLRALGQTKLGRRQMERQVRHNAYRPELLARGFAVPSRAPGELSALVSNPPPRQVQTLVEVMVEGGGPPAPLPPPLLLFGRCDRLWRTDEQSARKVAATLPGASLVFIEDAGHLPQVENPAAFIAALEDFIASRSGVPLYPQDAARRPRPPLQV